jgi:cell wall-associated NlpC family hydrolase
VTGGRAVVAGLVLAVGLVALPAAVSLSAAAAAGGQTGGSSEPAGSSAAGAVGAIPAAYLSDFHAAAARFGVPWGVLAGIYRLECDFGQSRLAGCNPPGTENSSGAQGPGQFLAPTWRRGLAPGTLIPPGPPTASVAGGYATDGDGDGVADVWDPADAIAATARLLAANGAAQGDIEAAVFAYNHDSTYVHDVMTLAAGYQAGAQGSANGSSPAGNAGGDPAGASGGAPAELSAGVSLVLRVALAQLGKPYLWGGAGPRAFDCSGLVMVAFAEAGVVLPHNAAEQYALTAGQSVPLAALQPGDLVFFGASVPSIEHVGIVVGDGDMIDAPHTGAVVRVESYDWNDLVAATRPLA